MLACMKDLRTAVDKIRPEPAEEMLLNAGKRDAEEEVAAEAEAKRVRFEESQEDQLTQAADQSTQHALAECSGSTNADMRVDEGPNHMPLEDLRDIADQQGDAACAAAVRRALAAKSRAAPY
eukprot:12407527-Karenia_brevis.AAC.1